MGRRVLERVAASPDPERFFASHKGEGFVRALGQLFLAAQVLEAAMRTYVEEQQRPALFDDCLRRCSNAWDDGRHSHHCDLGSGLCQREDSTFFSPFLFCVAWKRSAEQTWDHSSTLLLLQATVFWWGRHHSAGS